MKTLHLSLDDIFVDSALDQFNRCGLEQNDLMVWSSYKELKKVNSKPLSIINFDSNLQDLKSEIANYDLIVFHSLVLCNARVMLHCIGENQKSIWLIHGYEAYTSSAFKTNQFISKKTRALVPENNKDHIKDLIRPVYERMFTTDNKTILSAAKKVDYLGIFYKEEFDFLSSRMSPNSSWFPFSYYPLSKIIGDNDAMVSGENILLGNSATAANNHIDIIEDLAHENFNNRKVICPLSYGDENYADKIRVQGKQKLGESFNPLTDFMELSAYNKILNSCSITFMNHQRQQALGTIMAMIYKGSRVFLNEQNTAYHFLNRIGVIIEETSSKPWNLNPLNIEEKKENRRIMESFLSEKVLIEKMTTSLNQIMK